MANDVTTSERQLVVFGLAGETYGVDISSVKEIIQMQDITAVPGTSHSVEGVTNLRGTVIPVIDLRKRFGLQAEVNNKNTRIVVINSGDNPIGVIVDSVDEVLRVPADSIEPPSQMIVSSRSDYLLGIVKLNEKLVILLDTDKMLSHDDASELITAAGVQDARNRAGKNGDESEKEPLLKSKGVSAVK